METTITSTFKKDRSVELYFGPFADRRVASFHLNRRRKNLVFTLTDLTGAVVGSSSSKAFVADRKKRFAPHIIDSVVKRLVAVLKAYRIEIVRIFIKMASKHFFLKTAVRSLIAQGIKVATVMDLFPLAHNGCRRRKARRL